MIMETKKQSYEITLLITDKPGVISTLMVKGNLIGLAYRRKKSEGVEANKWRVVLTFHGSMICSQKEAIQVFQSDPAVIKVEKVVILDDQGGMTTINPELSFIERMKNNIQNKWFAMDAQH